MAVIAPEAHADELSSLKAQLEALQSQVNTVAAAQPSLLPNAKGLVSFERGQASLGNWGQDPRDAAGNNPDAGFTIAITPVADMPAPVAEITVYGYVKGDVLWDSNGMTNKYSFSLQSLAPAYNNGTYGDGYVNLHAFQSRFGIKSKVDTAVGLIRTRIEGDFLKNVEDAGLFRVRYAYGEWDLAPGWMLTIGQTDYLENVTNIGIPYVDFFEEAGPTGRSRAPQVRLTYTDGPLTWAVAMEDATWDSSTAVPNFAGFVGYKTESGSSFQLTGVVSDYDVSASVGSYTGSSISTCADTKSAIIGYDSGGNPVYSGSIPCAVLTDVSNQPSGLGWAIMGGASFPVTDNVSFNVGANYGFGEVVPQLNQTANKNQRVDANGNLMEAWSIQSGLSVGITQTTSFNLGAGFEEYLGALADEGWIHSAATVHANILWQPVSQLKLGWEVMWGEINYANRGICLDSTAVLTNAGSSTVDYGGCKSTLDDVRFQFGAWFYF
ncbi:MAG: hypothetical protein U1E46_13630 [Hyphomicrobiales bacterium]